MIIAMTILLNYFSFQVSVSLHVKMADSAWESSVNVPRCTRENLVKNVRVSLFFVVLTRFIVLIILYSSKTAGHFNHNTFTHSFYRFVFFI